MKTFCIPKSLAANLKSAAQRGEIDIKQLYDMSSEKRREVFEKYTDKETATNINIGFEESILSSQKTALKKWAEKTFVGGEQKKEYKDVLTKIEQLEEIGALSLDKSDGFLNDLVASKLGVSVTQEETKKILEFTGELQKIQETNPTNKFGQPSLEYLKKRQEINLYLDSLVPSHQLSVLTSTIGRANMLLSPKTAVLNVIGNSGLLTLEGVSRRISTGIAKGVNGNLVTEYIKEQIKIYKETQFDLSRMVEPDFSPTTLGEKRITTQGKGVVRKVGRLMEDIVFKYELGLPDAAYAATNFADALDLFTTQQAQREGLKGAELKKRAQELFLEGTSLDPNTSEIGQQMRSKAIMESQRGTATDNTKLAQVASKLRDVINSANEDLRLGDVIIPFVKTPANFISRGIDYSVFGFIEPIKNFPTAYKEMKAGKFETWDSMKTKAIRAGLGTTLAFLLISMLDPDDFQDEYPAGTFEGKSRDIYNLENKVANSIRIGDKWISLDYFGALAPTIKGFMSAKTYQNENDPLGKALSYGRGILSSLKQLPGINEFKDTLSNITDKAFANNPNFVSDLKDDAVREGVDFFSSRLIPAILGDVAKATDTVERKASYENPLEQVKAKIPGLRQELPAKINMFGQEVKTEQPLSILLFGSRLKTRAQSEIIDEITKLDKDGMAPTVSDPEKTSDRLKIFKGQVSEEKYNKAIKDYRDNLSKVWSETIKTKSYQKSAIEEKQKSLNDIRTDLLDYVLEKYNYKPPKKKK